MPSPFPGMDPFLEHSDVFPGFHDGLIAYLRESLQPLLPDPYFADMGRRTWIEVSERFIEPDVEVLRTRSPRGDSESGGVAVLSPTATKPIVLHIPHDEHHEPFLEIYSGRGKNRRLVTSIEVLSPANKTPGEHGRDLYVKKQLELLDSKVHLVEIDLLRGGEHTTTVPLNRLRAKTGSFDYHVCVHQFDCWEDYFIYPIQLPDALPTVSIPLLPGDDPVPVNLQAVFTRCYETGPYAREIDYRQDRPIPPLKPRRARWAKQLLTGSRHR